MDDLFGDNEEEQQQERQPQEEPVDALAEDLFGDDELATPASAQPGGAAPSFSSFLQQEDPPVLTEEQQRQRQELEYEETYDSQQYTGGDADMGSASKRIADLMFLNLPRPTSKGAVSLASAINRSAS